MAPRRVAARNHWGFVESCAATRLLSFAAYATNPIRQHRLLARSATQYAHPSRDNALTGPPTGRPAYRSAS